MIPSVELPSEEDVSYWLSYILSDTDGGFSLTILLGVELGEALPC
jgi:hypothetical protein